MQDFIKVGRGAAYRMPGSAAINLAHFSIAVFAYRLRQERVD
jgi:hypothetical protein